MYARMTILEGRPDAIDSAASTVETDVLPVVREHRGFRGFTVMADRSSGQMIGVSYWEAREDMDASEEAVRASRQRAAEASGTTSAPVVEHYEILLDVEE